MRKSYTCTYLIEICPTELFWRAFLNIKAAAPGILLWEGLVLIFEILCYLSIVHALYSLDLFMASSFEVAICL